MSRFFFVYFTIIGVKKIFRYIEVLLYKLLLLACSARREKIDLVSLRESPYVDIQISNCLFFRQSVMLV